MTKSRQQKFLFYFATVFFAVLIIVFLSLVIFDVDESSRSFSQLMWISRLICALSAGIIVAALPGTLEISWADKPSIKATGAVAAFVLVFYVNPPEITAAIANNLSDYDEALIRCENGLQHATGARDEAYSNCPLLLEMDISRWEGYYHNGRLAWWDKDYYTSIKLQAHALELLRAEETPDARNISRVLSGLNYARIANLKPEDLTDLTSDVVNILESQTIFVTDDSRINLLLQYSAAVILEDGLIDIPFWEINSQFLENLRDDKRIWADYYISCISLLLNPTDEEVRNQALQRLNSITINLGNAISPTSFESAQLMTRLLTPGPIIYDGYRAGFPPRCLLFFETFKEDDLDKLRQNLG